MYSSPYAGKHLENTKAGRGGLPGLMGQCRGMVV